MTDKLQRDQRAVTVVEPVTSLLAALEQLDDGGEDRKPFATGYSLLDSVLEGGFKFHDLVLVGGRPGVGKTIATLQWARAAALSGRRTVFACYEHDEHDLLARLLLMEIGELPRPADVSELPRVRSAVRRFASGELPLEQLLGYGMTLRAAYERLKGYSQHLVLVKASGTHTDLAALAEMVPADAEPTVLFVDYLQKVAVPGVDWDDSKHVTVVTEGLKEIALMRPATVVAITAAEGLSLTARRVRSHHLRGAAALAYEADVILMLNEKLASVSRVHLNYGPSRGSEFDGQVVFSIEKNRGGPAGIDVEFDKDFTHFRFNPEGRHVKERLIDDSVYRD